ncbi:MAG: HEAT repeat domain-containing protein, partial [Holophaga sp.]|nr:HEAT repeat domain-containing protein [Holophaga sp.]
MLRALLSDYSDGRRSFEVQFQKSLTALQQQALPELGQRLARTTTPSGLRRLILQSCATFDWPEWEAHLMQMLQQEEDMELFTEGCSAMAGLCTPTAVGKLLRLKQLRKDPERQAILDQVLGNTQPRYPLEDYFSWLQAGQSDPTVARLGAMGLSALCGPDQLTELMEVITQGDALTRHLALRIMAFVKNPAANSLLLFLLQKTSLERHNYRKFRTVAATLEKGTRETLRDSLLGLLSERFGETALDQVAALRQALTTSEGRKTEALDALAPLATHPVDAFLIKALTLLAEGMSSAIAPLVRKTLAELPALEAACSSLVDEITGLLAGKVETGEMPLAEVIPLMDEAFQTSAGGDISLIAYLRILPPDDKQRMGWVLTEPNLERRERCIEILGAREEDALAPVFIKAMNGPDPAISRVAVRQLGKLPSGAPAMMILFRSEQLEGMRQAVHFFGENRVKSATKPLMSLLPSESPDDLLVDAAVALGKIGDPVATTALLNLLHDGKPMQMQVALAEALGSFGTPAAALGLLAKAEGLKMSQVLILALEGAVAAFPNFETPFPPEQITALEALTDRCCDVREGAGQWARAGLALKNLFVYDEDCYRRLKEKFAPYTLAARHHSSAEREAAEHVAEALRLWSFRATSLSLLDEREEALKSQLEALPSPGEKRILALARIREALTVPELVLNPVFAKHLVAFV